MTLNELNFNRLIKIDFEDINKYNFSVYEQSGCKHPKISDYCTLCEEKNLKCCDDTNFKLNYISHGAHSDDFLRALKSPISTEGWHNDAVMFVMENSSKNYNNMYEEISVVKSVKEYKKSPSVVWYWIHERLDYCEYPEYFKGRTYGDLVESAILTFKLKNAYLTNLVKCGLNDRGIGSISEECIENCIKEYLAREIEIVNPKVIFTFGSNGYYYVDKFFGGEYKIVGLPHPAGAQRGFKNEYYNVLYFCMMAKWLCKTGVINIEYYNRMMELFLKNN